MNTSTSEYASVGTDTGLTVPTSATTPTTMKGAATTETEAKRPVPTRIGRAQLQAIAERLDETARRSHRTRNFCRSFCRFLCNLYRSEVELLDFIRKMIVLELQ